MKATLKLVTEGCQDRSGFVLYDFVEPITKEHNAEVDFYYTKKGILARCTMSIVGYDDIYEVVKHDFGWDCNGYGFYLMFCDNKEGMIIANTDYGFMLEIGSFFLREGHPDERGKVIGKMCIID